MNFRARLANLRAELDKKKVDALLVTHLPNVRYLCGFTGSAGMLLAARRPVFFTDGRYAEQASSQVQGARIAIIKGSKFAQVAAACVKLGLKRVGIESEHVTVAECDALETALGRGIKLVRLPGVVEVLRVTKDAEEVELLRNAVNLSSGLFQPLLRTMHDGVSESAVAAKLEYMARRAGAEAMSFETIVASGERSALPHGVASPAKLPTSGFVVLDYGVVLDGYCSDMTRTVHLGKAPEKKRSTAYHAVLDAQLAAISVVRGGVAAGEVDRAARQELRRAKLDRFFVHSTGHGVGLEIHELPRVAARNDTILQPGMVITIEPGVYLPGQFGVRIEDMVLVTDRGYEVLTPVNKELIELN